MRKTQMTVACLAAALLLLGGSRAPSASQQAPAPPPEAELVSMDFIALGPDGRPVKDLTPGQVVLRIGGRARAIHGLQYVELGSGEVGDRSGVIPKPLPLPFGSNMLADAGRVVMLVINHESIGPGRERPVREAAIKFLRTLSTRDRVGLVTLPRGTLLAAPTRDHDQVRTALLQVTGQAPQTAAVGLGSVPGMTGQTSSQVATSDRACMSGLALNELAGLLPSLGTPDEPKTIVFVSSGLTPPTRDAAMNRAPGPCEVKPEHYENVATAARAARAHFYVVQPHEIITDSASDTLSGSRFRPADEALAGLQNLAGATGGELFRLSASPADPVFTRVASESSGYYIVDFRPEPGERNGLAHRVEVLVSAPDVRVRHHSQLVLDRPEGRKDPKFLTPQDMLRGARRFRTLPVRAIAYPAQSAGGLAVLAIAEPMDPSVKLTSAAMGLVDSRNSLVHQWTANKNDLAGGSLLANFPVSPGAYRLRVAAIDSQGRHGTVEYAFSAELTQAGPLKLSGIALGVSRDGGFEPRMVFGEEPAAVVYVEMYGRMRQPAVRIELAESMDGPAVVSVPATVQQTADAERQIAVGALAITGIFPGDYLVRVVVTDDGRPLGRATRTLRKVHVEGGR